MSATHALALLGGLLVACAAPKPDAPTPAPLEPPSAAPPVATPLCPPTATAPTPLPGITAAHETVAYWKARSPDSTLLSPAEVSNHNLALSLPGEPDSAPDVFVPEPAGTTSAAASDRLAWLRERIEKGEYVDGAGARPPLMPIALATPVSTVDELRVTLAPIPLRCGPTAAPLYTKPPNPAFDRNLCSTLPAQEVLRVAARYTGGFLLTRTRAALGFVAGDAPLSPALNPAEAARLAAGPFAVTTRPLTLVAGGAQVTLPAGLRLVRPAPDRVLFADATGLHEAVVPTGPPGDASALQDTARPLTRHALLDEAFRALGSPYGWGGMDGGRDCSQFVLEVLGTFGLDLPRNSSQQGITGTYTVEIAPEASARERLALLDAAQASGVVLLHLQGHIMFYLGRDAAGVPMALHSFAEYVEPCPGEGETLLQVGRVAVSTLSLGEGSKRRSFLERLVHLTVFGPTPQSLSDVATPRPALAPEGPCPESAAATLFVSPARPDATRPVRVIAVNQASPGAATLVLEAPDGARVTPPVHRLGGPPFGQWTQLEAPTAGQWTARFGDGAKVLACRKFTVAAATTRRKGRGDPESDGSVWKPTRSWDRPMEDLYALFVEQLFAYPLNDELTWPNLQVLLQEPGHNLLYDHLGAGEDAELELAPDCADLPFMLRAYFSWKLRLPYGVRPCAKAGAGRPPRCGALSTSLSPREAFGEADGFQGFADHVVQVGAQSASGRTHPDDEETDLYPVPLTREALRPGTVFADPYGHLLIVAQWLPQRPGGTGELIGAEAQPDATIGRRRFWRGSFLFRPELEQGGAGFKAFRPMRLMRTGEIMPATNKELGRWFHGAPPLSRQQYDAPVEAFYDSMDALMNPRPVEPATRAQALVTALEESAVRRTKSVANGEDFQRATPRTIAMPTGARIFQSKGPWEDFSTPSRDFRLLIALDTVLGFPEAIARRPALFGLGDASPEAVAHTVSAVRTQLNTLLTERRFSYVRSDGSPFSLRLLDLVGRMAALEIAYNPNDCPEIRWGAPPGSPEAATCLRRAPREQLARMEGLRRWFKTRTRPLP